MARAWHEHRCPPKEALAEHVPLLADLEASDTHELEQMLAYIAQLEAVAPAEADAEAAPAPALVHETVTRVFSRREVSFFRDLQQRGAAGE